MDFKQLEAYVKVIELSSFSRAAEAIFLSQPSVSAYINGLERELGTVLINRSTKELSPTLAGRIFYENARELIALKQNTLGRLKNLSGNLSGEISILASTVPSQYVLPRVLACFNKVYPDISFTVKQKDTVDVARGIAAQKAEIGFCGGLVKDDKCEFKEFMTEKIVFIAPRNGKYSDTREYSPEELLYEGPFVAREKGSGTGTQYENHFAGQNIDISKINVCACFDNTQSIINAVINGLGVSVVSEFAARVFIEQKMVLPLRLTYGLPERKLYYVLKKNFFHSHLIELFVEFLCSPALKI
ncbi:MAG: selenium metabolism-associated LysR family transcriptional regulator [Clostridiales bacterium]|nr:selenium metabolism-associated LysR family transcriptional regulator [Clostridiales bacterium]